MSKIQIIESKSQLFFGYLNFQEAVSDVKDTNY